MFVTGMLLDFTNVLSKRCHLVLVLALFVCTVVVIAALLSTELLAHVCRKKRHKEMQDKTRDPQSIPNSSHANERPLSKPQPLDKPQSL